MPSLGWPSAVTWLPGPPRPMQVALHPESAILRPSPRSPQVWILGNGGCRPSSLSGSWPEPCPSVCFVVKAPESKFNRVRSSALMPFPAPGSVSESRVAFYLCPRAPPRTVLGTCRCPGPEACPTGFIWLFSPGGLVSETPLTSYRKLGDLRESHVLEAAGPRSGTTLPARLCLLSFWGPQAETVACGPHPQSLPVPLLHVSHMGT